MEAQGSKPATQLPKGKITPILFIIIAIIGILSQAIAVMLGFGAALIYAIILILIGFPLFLKARKATVPSFAVYSVIFTASAILSVLGVIIAFVYVKERKFM